MAESKSSEWSTVWIERQREILRKQAAAAADAAKAPGGGAEAAAGAIPGMTEEVRKLGEQWRALLGPYLSGMAQPAPPPGAAGTDAQADTQADTQAGAQFNIGDELLHVWRNAWTTAGDIQQGAASGISDLLARLPPLGLAREHTVAWRELAAAQAECQRLETELRTVWLRVQGEALDLLERRLREPARQGEPPISQRDLYNLWVDCAEQVYAQVAHSAAYCKLQAQLGNASMRLRSHQQQAIERGLKQFDLPTRSELNTVHRQLREQKQKIVNLELQLQQAGAPADKARRAPAKKTVPQQAGAGKRGSGQAVSRKTGKKAGKKTGKKAGKKTGESR